MASLRIMGILETVHVRGVPLRVGYRAHPDTKFSALKTFITLEGQEG